MITTAHHAFENFTKLSERSKPHSQSVVAHRVNNQH